MTRLVRFPKSDLFFDLANKQTSDIGVQANFMMVPLVKKISDIQVAAHVSQRHIKKEDLELQTPVPDATPKQTKIMKTEAQPALEPVDSSSGDPIAESPQMEVLDEIAPSPEPEPVESGSPKSTLPEPEPENNCMEIWTKVKLPWFAGCEYRCKICHILYFYNEVCSHFLHVR